MLWRAILTSQKEMQKINSLRNIILREKSISKVRLVMEAKISISYYDKLKPFLEEIYSYEIQYDKGSKNWLVMVSDESNN